MFRWLRNLALVVALIAVIVLSFWISFLIGKKMLVPVKKLPTQYLITDEARLELPPEISLEVEGLTFESGVFVAKKPAIRPGWAKQKKVAPVMKKTFERKALKKQVQKRTEVTKKTEIVKSEPAVKGAYTVQIGSFSRRANAQALVSQLKKKGFTGQLIVSGKWFRVCSGSFADSAQARAYMSKLGASGFEGIIRREN